MGRYPIADYESCAKMLYTGFMHRIITWYYRIDRQGVHMKGGVGTYAGIAGVSILLTASSISACVNS